MNEDRFLCIISWRCVIDLPMKWTTLNVSFYIHECERIKLKSVCRVKEDCFGAFHISLSYIIRENSFKLNLNNKYINFFFNFTPTKLRLILVRLVEVLR